MPDALTPKEIYHNPAYCVDCHRPASNWIGWPDRLEGPYPVCEMCENHSVKNRGATELGAYDPTTVPVPAQVLFQAVQTACRRLSAGWRGPEE